MLTGVVELVCHIVQHRYPANGRVFLLGKTCNMCYSRAFQDNYGVMVCIRCVNHPISKPVAVGVGQHGEVIEQPQHRSAVAELSREQQQALPEPLGPNVRLCLPGKDPSDQLGPITHCPDLQRQTEKKRKDSKYLRGD